MKPDQARFRETDEWLAKAGEDLASARVLLASGHWGNALFFCQQAAEKSLKAFLTWHNRPFRRTHDLEQLGEGCAGIDHTLASLVEEADVLSDYAWKLRYPGSVHIAERAESGVHAGARGAGFSRSTVPPEIGVKTDHSFLDCRGRYHRTMTRDEAIAEITRRLIEFYDPERIYLFGSAARGDYGPDSDLDFLVVVPDDIPAEKLRGGAVYSYVSGTGHAKDIVPWRCTDFNLRARHVVASLPATVEREGKLLYDAR